MSSAIQNDSTPQAIEARREAISRTRPEWIRKTLYQHLELQARACPDQPFLVSEERQYSYGESIETIRALARGLLAIGIKPGDHAAMVMGNCPELVLLRMALAAIGAVGVPINTLLKPQELKYVLQQSDSAILVCMDKLRGVDFLSILDDMIPDWEKGSFSDLPGLRSVIVFETASNARTATAMTYARLLDRAGDIPELELDACIEFVDPDSLLDIVYTSGTTGLPKGVMLTHDTVLRCSFTASLARALRDRNRMFFALPLYHSYAYIEGLMAATWVRGTVVLHDKFDPLAVLQAIERFKINEILLVPTMSIALLEHPRLSEFDFSSVRAVMSAAAQAPARLWSDICEAFGVTEVTTAYGQTELTSSASYKRPEEPVELLVTTVGRLKPRSVAGTPQCDGRVALYRVVDPETGEELPQGVPGELIAFGPEMMLGYYNKPEENAAVFRDDKWMRTGDLGYIRDDGCIVLTGRRKELYKCGAELVAPAEIETFLSQLEDVSQAYIVGIPDERMGEVGVAFIVPVPGRQPSCDAIRNHCSERLARFKVPRHVFVIDAGELPTTATGKIQKFLLREIAVQRLVPR